MERVNLFIRLFFIVSFSFVFFVSKAQSNSDPSQHILENTGFHYYLPGNSFTSNVPLNEIRSSVFRAFLKAFPAAFSSHWTKTPEGYRVYFKAEDSISYCISYTRRGHLIGEHIIYPESCAPADIKEIINELYPGYLIEFVNGFNDGNTDIYGIVIRRGNMEKSLKLQQGNLELILQFENPVQPE